MNYPSKSERILWVLSLALMFALGMVRVAITPLWLHYDEASHYDYVRYLIVHRALPQPHHPDPAIVDYLHAVDPDRHYELRECTEAQDARHVCWQPAQQFDEMPGYYLLQATALAISRPPTLAGQLALMRTVSLMLGVGVGAIMIALIRRVFPNQRLLAVAVPLVMGLNFAFIDLMSALNNDVGAVFAFHLMVLSVIYVICRGFTRGSVALITLALILCIVSKVSAWIGVPIAALGVGIALTPRLRVGQHLAILAVLGLLVLGIGLYWEPGVGLLFRPAIDRLIPFPGSGNNRLAGWYDPQNWSLYWPAIRWQVVTFWTGYGNGQPGLPSGGVAIYGALMVVSAAGLARLAISRWGSLTRAQSQSLLFLILTLAFAATMSLFRIDPVVSGSIYYIPTARHFYIVAGPSMMLFVLGLGAWFAPTYRRVGLMILVLLLYALGLWSLIGVQIKWFAPYL